MGVQQTVISKYVSQKLFKLKVDCLSLWYELIVIAFNLLLQTGRELREKLSAELAEVGDGQFAVTGFAESGVDLDDDGGGDHGLLNAATEQATQGIKTVGQRVGQALGKAVALQRNRRGQPTAVGQVAEGEGQAETAVGGAKDVQRDVLNSFGF